MSVWCGRLGYGINTTVFLKNTTYPGGAIFVIRGVEEKNIRRGGLLSDMYYSGTVIPLGDKKDEEYPLLMDGRKWEKDISEECLYYLRDARTGLSEKQASEIGAMNIDEIVAKEKAK